jgi:hypothetical protein
MKKQLTSQEWKIGENVFVIFTIEGVIIQKIQKEKEMVNLNFSEAKILKEIFESTKFIFSGENINAIQKKAAKTE